MQNSGSRLATEIQSDFGTATYLSTFESMDAGSSRSGNMRTSPPARSKCSSSTLGAGAFFAREAGGTSRTTHGENAIPVCLLPPAGPLKAGEECVYEML